MGLWLPLSSARVGVVGPKHARIPSNAHSRGTGRACQWTAGVGPPGGIDRPDRRVVDEGHPADYSRNRRQGRPAPGSSLGRRSCPAVAGARPSARVGIEWHPVPLHLAPQRQETAPCGCERLWPPRCCSRPTDPRRHPRPHARPTADRGPGLRHRQQPISGPTACSLRQRCEVPLVPGRSTR